MPETNDSNFDVNDVAEARAKFEQARLTRRSALRKLGMTSGMALFGMFAIDDLARLAVKKLAQHQETKAIADSIAHDFKDMGVAFADGGSSSDRTPDCGGKTTSDDCTQCCQDGCNFQWGCTNQCIKNSKCNTKGG